MSIASFAQRLIGWQQQFGRHDLPWQGGDAYRVWLSEIMLQQTQVATVIPYFQRFIQHYPDVVALADADEDRVLALWSGLGYYARARNLHKAAKLIMVRHSGQFPAEIEALQALPGVGRSTAAAISALAFHQRHAILDGNVRRVLTRYQAVPGWPGDARVEVQLWRLAEELLPEHDVAIYTQAMMDLGATICTRSQPDCEHCPVHTDCRALARGAVAQFPAPRPSKVIPERRAVFLIVRDGAKVWLEKRPSTGVWGGLWCAPQFDSLEMAIARAEGMGADVAQMWHLPPFAHAFTHFRLQLEPIVVKLSSPSAQDDEAHGAWFEHSDALRAGIPTPMRKILTLLGG